jgi:cytochrome c oxidase cbb3-type subunit III
MSLLVLLTACRREWRDIQVAADQRSTTSLSYRESELLAGGSPPVRSGQQSVLPTKNPYQGVAHAIVEGEKLYLNFNCVGCHAQGGGAIGPAFIDRSWLYGESPERVYESIARGRPNGMPAWGHRLAQFQIWQLVTYVRALGGLEPISAGSARSDALAPASGHPSRPAEDLK